MTWEEQIEARPLNEALRDGDPAAIDSALTDAERRRIRGRLLSVEPGSAAARTYRWLRPALAVWVVGAIALAVFVKWPAATRVSEPNASSAAHSAVSTETKEPREIRQVRFVTSGGTQVIWLLDVRPKL